MQRGSVISDGILFPVNHQKENRLSGVVNRQDGAEMYVIPGDYVEEFLGITEYKP